MHVDNNTIANKRCQHILIGSMPGGGEKPLIDEFLRTLFDNKEKIRASSYLSYCILVLCFLYLF